MVEYFLLNWKKIACIIGSLILLTSCEKNKTDTISNFKYLFVRTTYEDSLVYNPYDFSDFYLAKYYLDSVLENSQSIEIIKEDNYYFNKEINKHNKLMDLVLSYLRIRTSLNKFEVNNYIRPYRAGNERIEPYFDTLQSIVKQSANLTENSNPPIEEVITKANSHFKTLLEFDLRSHAMLYEPGMLELLKIGKGSCRSLTQFAALAFRTVGIPTTIDECPVWGHRNSGHQWNAYMNEDKEWIPFGGCETNPDEFDTISDSVKAPKIFRNTFSVNEDYAPSNKTESEIPPLFHRTNRIDVTKDYVAVSDVILDIENPQDEILYLAVFNAFNWKIVSWAEIDGNQAHFNDMGSNKIVYLSCYYINRRVVPAGNPFLLDSTTQIELSTSNNSYDTLTLDYYNTFFDFKWNIGRPNAQSQFDVLYWENNDWKNAGRGKSSQDSTIQFTNVPKNALMVLKSHDFDNTWQRIFTVNEEGEQVFY